MIYHNPQGYTPVQMEVAHLSSESWHSDPVDNLNILTGCISGCHAWAESQLYWLLFILFEGNISPYPVDGIIYGIFTKYFPTK